MEVNNKGIIYYFKKDKNENNLQFYERCRIASKDNPINEKILEKSIQKSKMKIYEKYLGCQYD